MKFTLPLVVIPFPDGSDSHKGHLFAHDPSVLVSTWTCKVYVSNLYIAPGKPRTAKVFVCHSSPAAIFNSMDFTKRVNEINCTVKVCAIQSNKVVGAGYLNDLIKRLDPEHFTNLLYTIPRLKNLDVEVKNLNITDITADETKPINSRDRVFAAHILCAKKNEEEVNAALGNTYCKVRKASQVAGEYPDGQNMQYAPIKMTGNIAHTPKRFKKLQKNRMTHKWSQERHHPIPFIGFFNI